MTDIASAPAASIVLPEELVPAVLNGVELGFLPRNQDVDWDSFAPGAYWEQNYRALRNDDQAIIQMVGEFFSRHFQNTSQSHSLRALDVGSGGNLYPALAMLPWSLTVTLVDVSTASVEWLTTAVAGLGTDDARGRWVWQPFWSEFARYPGYQQVADPRSELAARQQVRHHDLQRLEPGRWDVGTMFFVADSITTCPVEFEKSVTAFVRALAPGAPFAAAFMERPVGYTVAGQAYPAVQAVDVALVQDVLSRLTTDLSVSPVDVRPHDPEQAGYHGMIVATGIAGTAGH